MTVNKHKMQTHTLVRKRLYFEIHSLKVHMYHVLRGSRLEISWSVWYLSVFVVF
jgi:hypothetical protein